MKLPSRAGRRHPVAMESLVTRCATLLRAGIPTTKVFAVIASESGRSEAESIAARISYGEGVPDAIAAQDRPEWRVVSAAWRLAERSGAPLAPALERIAASLRELAVLREHRSVLLSGPRATVRMVLALPPLGLMLSVMLGFDPSPVLFSPMGALLLVLGAALLGLGAWWAHSLTVQVARDDRISWVEHELTWIALRGGADPSTALVHAADAVDQAGAEWVRFDGFLSESPLRAAIAAAAEVGVAVGPMLLEEARAERARSHAVLERAAERLSVRVLVPLGVCVLPAFIMLGVLPVLFSMLGSPMPDADCLTAANC